MSRLKPGDTFANEYKLQRLLGSGGFSDVWLAQYSVAGNMEVALKIYAPEKGLDSDGQNTFMKEYQLVYNLIHQHLLTAKHFGVFDGSPYLVMPYCKNGSALKHSGEMDEKQLAVFMQQAASALAYLHRQNPPIIHQDIKPDNFMIDNEGNYLLADFGISSRIRRTLTKSIGEKSSAGTLAYMPPEKWSANKLIIKEGDVFSLGATMYELLTGELPFGDHGGLALKAGADIPNLPNTFSAELNNLLKQCMALHPADRPTTEQLNADATIYLKTNKWPVIDITDREFKPKNNKFEVEEKKDKRNSTVEIPKEKRIKSKKTIKDGASLKDIIPPVNDSDSVLELNSTRFKNKGDEKKDIGRSTAEIPKEKILKPKKTIKDGASLKDIIHPVNNDSVTVNKKPKRKRLRLFIIISIIIICTISFFVIFIKNDKPQVVLEKYLDCMIKGDFNGAKKYCTETVAKYIEFNVEEIGGLKLQKFYYDANNKKFNIWDKSDTLIEFHTPIEVNSDYYIIELRKKNGKWLISLDDIVFVNQYRQEITDSLNRQIEKKDSSEKINEKIVEKPSGKISEKKVDSPIFTVVEDMPSFPGGDEARIKFLRDNINYPQMAKENGIQGTVYVTFVVEENGKVTDVKVLRGIGSGCDEEAVRVVKMMPLWKPGKQSGKAVRVQFNMPIRFVLS